LTVKQQLMMEVPLLRRRAAKGKSRSESDQVLSSAEPVVPLHEAEEANNPLEGVLKELGLGDCNLTPGKKEPNQ